MIQDTTSILNIAQTVTLTVVVPFVVYYVKNHSPYTKDKRYIEQRLDTHDSQIDRLTVILDRVTEKDW